jgi:hypothetical protein
MNSRVPYTPVLAIRPEIVSIANPRDANPRMLAKSQIKKGFHLLPVH